MKKTAMNKKLVIYVLRLVLYYACQPAEALNPAPSPRRHSGAGPPAWMQVVEPRLEQAAEESSGVISYSRKAGMTNG